MKLKKYISLVLAMIICLCFASCSEKAAEKPENDDITEIIKTVSEEAEKTDENTEIIPLEPEKPEKQEEIPDPRIKDESSLAGLPFEGYNTDPPQITDPNEPVEEINYPPTTTQPYFISFQCYVNEINEDDMIVNPVKTSHEYNIIGEISIPLSAISDGSTPSRGDCYEVHYKGDILKTSPGTLEEILSVELVATGNKK